MTKLYLRDTQNNGAGYAVVRKSTALPNGTYNAGGADSVLWDLSETRGTNGWGIAQNTLTTLNNQTHYDAWMGKWVSEPLDVSSITTQTWTVAIAPYETNTNVNGFLAVSIYVLKSDDTVRGYVYDSHTSLGTEFTASSLGTGRVVTVAGASVAGVVSTDRLVVEVWHHYQQSMSTQYGIGHNWGGPDEFTNGYVFAGVDAPAAYISTPQTLFTTALSATVNQVTETDLAQPISANLSGGPITAVVTQVVETDLAQPVTGGIAAPQYVRPAGDGTPSGVWTGSYLDVDEVTPNDADYIESPTSPGGTEYYPVLLGAANPPGNGPHILRVRAAKDASGGRDISMTFELRNNGDDSVIAAINAGLLSDVYATYEATLTAGEVANIANYSDLRVRLNPTSSGGGAGRTGRISWVEFQIPAASTDTTVPVGIALSTAIAQPITARKSVAVGQVTETDLAQPITAQQSGGGQSIAVNQVVETDLAQVVTPTTPGGGAVTYRSASAGHMGGSSGTVVTVTLPTGATTGDLLVMMTSHRSQNAYVAGEGPTDQGWVEIDSGLESGGEYRVYQAYFENLTGVVSNQQTYVKTAADKIAWAMGAFTGVDATTQFVAEAGQIESGTDTTHDSPTINPGAESFLIALTGDRLTNQTSITWPSGWTERAEAIDTGTNSTSASIATYDANPAAAGAYSVTPTFGLASAQGWTWIGGLKAAAGGGPHNVNVGQASETDTVPGALSGLGLPGSVEGTLPEANDFIGPIYDTNGVIYAITETPAAQSNLPKLMRSTNGGEVWAEVNAANRPTFNDLESVFVLQDNQTTGLVHVITQDSSTRVRRHSFGTSDHATTPNVWITKDQVIYDSGQGVDADDQSLQLVQKSNGDLYVFYRHDSELVTSVERQRIAYRVSTDGGATWAAEVVFDTGTTFSAGQPVAVVGKDDKIHLFCNEAALNQVHYKSLPHGGAWSSWTRVDGTTGTRTRRHPLTNAVYQNLGGLERIHVAWADDLSGLWWLTVDNGTPGTPAQPTTTTVQVSALGNHSTLAYLRAHGPNLHILYADDVTDDLWHVRKMGAAAWGTPVEIRDASTIQWIFTNTTVRSGRTILGYLAEVGGATEDGAILEYNELDLGFRVTVSQAIETDLAQAVTRGSQAKNIAANQVTETDLSQPVGRAKRKAAGQTTETDLAQPVTERKSRAVSQNLEADLAQLVARAKRKALGQNLETDLAQPVTERKSRTVGQPAEADLSQPVAERKSRTVAQASEADLSQLVARAKRKALAQTVESDQAQPVGKVDPIHRGVAAAVETDLAQPVGRAKRKAVSQVVETDFVQAVTKIDPIRAAIGQAAETDFSQSVSERKSRAVGLVSETDLAQVVTRRKRKAVAQATATDLSQPATERKSRALGQVSETDLAQVVTPTITRRYVVVAQAVESDQAQAVSFAGQKFIAVSTALEADSAQPVGKIDPIRAGVAGATETDVAQAVGRAKRKTLAQAIETDTVTALGRRKTRTPGQVGESYGTFVQIADNDDVGVAGTGRVDELLISIGYNVEADLGVVTMAGMRGRSLVLIDNSAWSISTPDVNLVEAVFAAGGGVITVANDASSTIDIITATANVPAATQRVFTPTGTHPIATRFTQFNGTADGGTIPTAIASGAVAVAVDTPLGGYPVIAWENAAGGRWVHVHDYFSTTYAPTTQQYKMFAGIAEWVTGSRGARKLTVSKKVTLGQAVETDLAQVTARVKRKTLAQTSEADLAQPVAVHLRRYVAVAQPSESDVAQPVTPTITRRYVAVGQVSESDLARPVSGGAAKQVAVATAVESDQAQPVGKIDPIHRGIAQSAETDLAQSVGRTKRKGVAQVLESDLAQPVARRKARTVAQVLESDLAQPVTPTVTRRYVAVAQATESDVAQSVARRKRKTLAQISEADIAQPVARRKRKASGQVTETDLSQVIGRTKRKTFGQVAEADSAQPVGKIDPIHRAVVTAAETDLSQPVAHRKARVLGQVVEVDSAQGVTRRKVRPVAQTAENDLVQAIARAKRKSLAQATETAVAQPITLAITRRYIAVGQITETDTALPVSFAGQKFIAVGQVLETDTAQLVTVHLNRRITVGQTVESDAVTALATRKAKAIGQVVSTETAQVVQATRLITIGQASEVDTVGTTAVVKRVAVAQLVELDIATSLATLKHALVGQTETTDTAGVIIAFKGERRDVTVTLGETYSVWSASTTQPSRTAGDPSGRWSAGSTTQPSRTAGEPSGRWSAGPATL